MKVIKRDGRIVEYDKNKIITAIEKANIDVPIKEQAKKKDIDKIINYIESLDKKRILVEDIQDIIEIKLMELKKYELAKKYIVYRYNRALVRKQNTTDETILGLIRKNSTDFVTDKKKNLSLLSSTQRNLIAGEVSKDLTKRMLLPEKITIATNEGKFYFHDKEYFLQPIFNSSIIDIKDMLDNSTVMNGKLIESPKSFQVACNIMTQIILTIANCQYGEQSVNIKHLSKYLRISYDKFKKQLEEKYKDKIDNKILNEIIDERLKQELSSGVQTIQYQLNTLLAIDGYSPSVSLILELDEKDEYINETKMIIEEIFNQRLKGIKDELGIYQIPNFPKIIYVLNENNTKENSKYNYLTELSIKCAKTKNKIYYLYDKLIEDKNNKKITLMGSKNFLNLGEKDKKEGRFNQGIVSINLPQIAIISNTLEEFFTNLEERLELCYDALMCKHYALLQTSSDVSPVHYRYGAISRLKQNEKIDNLLKNGYSTLSLGYIGLKTTTEILKQKNIITDEKEIAIDILEKIRTKLDKWKKITTIEFNLYQTNNKEVINELIEIDNEKYDIENISTYINSFIDKNNDLKEELLFESKIQKLSNGGMVLEIDSNKISNYQEYIDFIFENIIYVKIV